MSYTSSNLYASRVYAEHPVALWAMDEPNYFVSLISQEEKEITESNWDFDNAISSASVFTLSGYPFEDLDVNKVYLATASAATVEFTVSLSASLSYLEFDPNKGSVCISNYIYIPEQTSTFYTDIGFVLDGQEFYTRYSSLKTNIWEKISHTESTDGVSFIPFIRVVYDLDASATETNSSIYFNGVSVGQWSEPYNSISTGITSASLVNLPSNISSLIDFSEVIKSTVLDSYGLGDGLDNGYITCLNNSLSAKLSGIPMVYGSSGNIQLNKDAIFLTELVDGSSLESITIDGGSSSAAYLEYIDGGGALQYSYLTEDQYYNFPSLVFPGKGFLNQYGYNKTLTTEFWLRISPETLTRRRIFGPLTSEDGIYIDRDFITVNVGNYSKSYFIGKWYRPMLVHFCQSQNEIFLMINGEKVISITIESLNISTFPIEDEDYLGFYTNEFIHIFEIDSFSIFPYVVAEQVAKKRYVFGQGVQEQEDIVASKNGTLSYVDFPFSGYSSTIRYPDRSKWNDGFYNNLVADDKGITLPDSQLPQIIFNNNSASTSYEKSLITSGFYEENYAIQDEEYLYISMDPNDTYAINNSYGTIYFSKLNQTSSQIRSIHSILKSSADVSTRQSLLYISNNFDGNTFEVAINSGSIQYIYNETILNSESVGASSYFAAGIDFDKIQQTYYSTVGSFFSRPESLSLNFAGNQEETFLGKIFSLSVKKSLLIVKENIFPRNVSS